MRRAYQPGTGQDIKRELSGEGHSPAGEGRGGTWKEGGQQEGGGEVMMVEGSSDSMGGSCMSQDFSAEMELQSLV